MDNSTRNFLVEKEQEQGFLTKNDIFDYVDKYNLPLDELERLCGLLVDKGTIIQEKQEKEFLDHESSYTSSKNKVDYEKIFKRALNIDCSLIPYINKLKRIQHPRRGEADKLIHQAKKGNSFARRRLVNISLKYVVKLAIWYHDKYDYPLADTIQEGNIGIIKAIEKIPLQGNRKFVTYFPWWSKQVIGRNLNEFNWLIRIPAYIHSDLFKIHKVAKRHFCCWCDIDHEFCPKLIKKISIDFNFSYKEAYKYYTYAIPPAYIEDMTSIESIIDDKANFQDKLIENQFKHQLKSAIDDILLTLKERERLVIIQRFGLNDLEPKTLEEVGEMQGVTRERIRQIEAKALRKLKHSSRIRTLKDYYFIM